MKNSGHYHFTIGDFRATIMSDGQSLLPVYPSYAINATKVEVEASLSKYFLDTQFYTLQCNALFIDNQKDKILIDTGAGSVLGDKLGKLFDHLKYAGIDSQEITKVLISHAHLDHIGGLVTDGICNFPQAEIFISEDEWKFWKKTSIDLSSMPLQEEFRQSFIDTVHLNLYPLKERIRTFKFGQEVALGVIAQEAVGHSPGHTAFVIHSKQEALLYAGDIFHHPVFDLIHPHWATAFDQDAPKAHQTRLRVLDQAENDSMLLMAYHMPFPALGHIQKHNYQYQWIPDMWKITC